MARSLSRGRRNFLALNFMLQSVFGRPSPDSGPGSGCRQVKSEVGGWARACRPDGEAWPREGGWCHCHSDTQLQTRASRQNNNWTELLHGRTLLSFFPEMYDSPENTHTQQLELELERVSLKKDSGPDQENNVRDMKKFLENNNDAMAANFEEKHHCDLDDGMIIHHPIKMMINNIERKPPEKVYFDHHDHHEVLRGIGFKHQPVLTFLD